MEESAFSEVWQAPAQALADDLVAAQVFTLFPGQAGQVDVALSPDTRFISSVAIFRQPAGTHWRAIQALPPSPRLCAAYAGQRAPSPAIIFRFEEYRVESHSRLLAEQGGHALPDDIVPPRTGSGTAAP